MTEAEWLTCDTPTLLLAHVRGTLSQRKDRLLAAALCSVIRDFILDERLRRAIEVAEKFADAEASTDELAAAYEKVVAAGREQRWFNQAEGREWDDAQTMAADAVSYCAVPDSSFLTVRTSHAADTATYGAEPDCSYLSMSSAQRALSAAAYRNTLDTDTPLFLRFVRDVAGNPFRRSSMPSPMLNVTRLARAIYAKRAFDRLPILADTLEDSGCIDQGILEHLRDSGPHVRGCWALDMVLGKA